MLHKSERIRQGRKASSVSGLFLLLLIFINAIILKTAFVHDTKWYCALFITLPLPLAAIIFDKQKKRVVLNQGEKVKWDVPTGNKTSTTIEVYNQKE
ncbi:MAG: Glutamate synthase protein 2 [Segetibacter sp.]|nr:Glutamate synthase protein 2 [Segetibacter sp.]